MGSKDRAPIGVGHLFFLLDFRAKIRYNLFMTTDTLRIIMGGCFLGMALLAVFYLRRRRLSLVEYTAWGMLAILLPAVGPFLVIWFHPGQKQGTH